MMKMWNQKNIIWLINENPNKTARTNRAEENNNIKARNNIPTPNININKKTSNENNESAVEEKIINYKTERTKNEIDDNETKINPHIQNNIPHPKQIKKTNTPKQTYVKKQLNLNLKKKDENIETILGNINQIISSSKNKVNNDLSKITDSNKIKVNNDDMNLNINISLNNKVSENIKHNKDNNIKIDEFKIDIQPEIVEQKISILIYLF